MYACMTPVGFDTSDKFENHCSKSFVLKGTRKLKIFAILFPFVAKLQKLVRWFDGNNEEKKRKTSDAISHR